MSQKKLTKTGIPRALCPAFLPSKTILYNIGIFVNIAKIIVR
jgi:hypothetical protein